MDVTTELQLEKAQVYVSPHAYHNGFEVDVDLK